MQLNWLFFLDPGTHAAIIITAAALTLAIAAEMYRPRRELSAPLGWRWGHNLTLAVLTWYVSHVASLAFILFLARWTQIHQFGLFHDYQGSLWLPLLVMLLVTQFISYVTHLLFHHVPWLWAVHAVHHSDVDVDVSTSFRHHPFEPLVFLPLLTPIVLLLGVPPAAVLGYKIVDIFLTIFSHSNVRLPRGLESTLSRFIVTPDFHRVHHSSESQFTNSNYGNIVPWFDYLFGTARKRDFDSHERFELGLEYARDRRSGRLDRLLLAPFSRRSTERRAGTQQN